MEIRLKKFDPLRPAF